MDTTVQMAIITLVGTAFASVMAYMTVKLNTLSDTADKTHTLVNSNMGAQLQLTASVSRTLANLTKDPTQEAAAVAAEAALAKHDVQQAKVDAGVKE